MKILSISTYDVAKKQSTQHYPLSSFYAKWQAWSLQSAVNKVVEKVISFGFLKRSFFFIREMEENNNFYYIANLGEQLYVLSVDTKLSLQMAGTLIGPIRNFLAQNPQEDIQALVSTLENFHEENVGLPPPSPPDIPPLTKIQGVKAEVKTTKEIILDNLEKMIQREGSIEELLDKTAALAADSFSFRQYPFKSHVRKKKHEPFGHKLSHAFSTLFSCSHPHVDDSDEALIKKPAQSRINI